MDLNGTDCHLNLRSKITRACLNVQGTTVTGAVLAAMEFCDLLCAHYDVTPP